MTRKDLREKRKEICDYYVKHKKEITSLGALAKQFGVSLTTIYNAFSEYNIKFDKPSKTRPTTERNLQIVDMYLNTDKTLSEIGESFGISKQRVEQIIKATKTENRLSRIFFPYNSTDIIYDGIRLWMNQNKVSKANLVGLMKDRSYSASYLSSVLRGTITANKPLIDEFLRITKLPYDFCFRITKEAEGLTAKWLINSDGYYPFCSNCSYACEREVHDLDEKLENITVCPNCGAKMSMIGEKSKK